MAEVKHFLDLDKFGQDELRTMIDRGWIQVMMFSQEEGDFRRTNIFDTDHLEDYAYLATKEGLLKHNGFR